MPKDMSIEKMHLRQRAYNFEMLVEPTLVYKVKGTAFRDI
jgi:hypothetical protein